MAERGTVAILLDGGFVKHMLRGRNGHFPRANEVLDLCLEIMKKGRLQGVDLHRIFYYDAYPLEGTAQNPISGEEMNFADSKQARQNRALIDSLAVQEDVAVRLGELSRGGWKLGDRALKSLSETPRAVTANDLLPDIKQKGVDMRIGLDIAWLSLKKTVNTLVLVTGDADFIPVMKFARREGLRVYVEPMGHGINRSMKVHSDCIL